MILREATIKYKGYDPNLLKPKSNKRICCTCDQCGRVRWVRFGAYHNLCHCCFLHLPKSAKTRKKIGEANRNRIVSDKTKKLISDHHADVSGELNPMFGKHHNKDTKDKISKKNKCKKIKLICKICNKNFEVIPTRKDAKFCSIECYGKWVSKNLGKDAPNWKGGFDRKRPYVLPESQCIKLNKRSNNSEFHHITKSIGVFIPKELHHHFYHNLKNGQGMGSMNMLAIQFINGHY